MELFKDKEFIKKINSILKNNGVIVFPTDTVWGMGCLPEKFEACQKIYSIKNRDSRKPLILMSCELKFLEPYIKNMPDMAKKLAQKHFPGAMTLVVEKSEKTADFLTSNLKTVGIRVPHSAVFQNLCKIVDGHVLATTSANFSNEPSAKNFEDAKETLGNLVDFVLPDFGEASMQLESTVVGFDETGKAKIFRQGAIFI